MISSICVPTQMWFGFEVASFLLHDHYGLTLSTILAGPLGFLLSSFIFFIFSIVLGINLLHLIIHLAIIGAISFILMNRRKISIIKQIYQISYTTIAIFIAFLCTSTFIVYISYYPGKNYLCNFVVRGLQIEISLINSFVYGINKKRPNLINLQNPIYASSHQRNSYLSSFHSSMLLLGGFSLKNSLIIPSIIVITEAMFSVYTLSNLLLKSTFLSLLSTFLFFNVSGNGWVTWFWFNSRSVYYADYVFYMAHNGHSAWFHPVMHYLMEYRASQFVIPISATILILLFNLMFHEKILITLGILLGLLLPLQFPAFISVFLFSIFYIISNLIPKSRIRIDNIRSIIFFVISFFSIALIPLMNLIPRENDEKLMKFEKLWENFINEGYFYPFIAMWGLNVGLFALFAAFFVWIPANFFEKLILAASTITWLIGNFMKFSDHPVHTTLYFMPTWALISSIFVTKMLNRMVKKVKNEETKGIILAIAILFYLSMVTSSILGIRKSMRAKNQIYNNAVEEVANFVKSNISSDSVFLIPQDDVNLLLIYCGYRVLRMNDMYMYICGYNWKKYSKEISQLIEKPDSNVLPFVTHSLELKTFRSDQMRHENDDGNHWKLIFSNSDYQIFERQLSNGEIR